MASAVQHQSTIGIVGQIARQAATSLLPGLWWPGRNAAVAAPVARIGGTEGGADTCVVIRTGVETLPDGRAAARVQPRYPSARAKIVASTADDDPVAGD